MKSEIKSEDNKMDTINVSSNIGKGAMLSAASVNTHQNRHYHAQASNNPMGMVKEEEYDSSATVSISFMWGHTVIMELHVTIVWALL